MLSSSRRRILRPFGKSSHADKSLAVQTIAGLASFLRQPTSFQDHSFSTSNTLHDPYEHEFHINIFFVLDLVTHIFKPNKDKEKEKRKSKSPLYIKRPSSIKQQFDYWTKSNFSKCFLHVIDWSLNTEQYQETYSMFSTITFFDFSFHFTSSLMKKERHG